MSKNNTKAKIMRVDFDKFKELIEIANKNSKTLKIIKNEQVNKIYFVSFDNEGNLNFIGKNSRIGVIDKIALMREMSENQDINQINDQLVALIDRVPDQYNYFWLSVGYTLAGIIVLGLLLLILPATSILLPAGFALGTLALLGYSFVTVFTVGELIRNLGNLYTSINNSSSYQKFIIPGSGLAIGALFGAIVGTLVPGIGTIIGAAVGAAVGLSVGASLVVIDYVRKKAENPLVLQQLADSLSVNEPLGSPVESKNRKFHNSRLGDTLEQNYQDYVGQYNKLFSSIKDKKEDELLDNKLHNNNLPNF
jgi:hypothetical protein